MVFQVYYSNLMSRLRMSVRKEVLANESDKLFYIIPKVAVTMAFKIA